MSTATPSAKGTLPCHARTRQNPGHPRARRASVTLSGHCAVRPWPTPGAHAALPVAQGQIDGLEWPFWSTYHQNPRDPPSPDRRGRCTGAGG